jgi:aromatic ring-opening dioxygenase catalytic subunit (LigB family)
MLPTFFINHGGGPCFFLKRAPMRAAWHELEIYLGNFAERLPVRPRAILAVSGHWEEAIPTVNISARPPLLFDYGGFPDYTYELTWPAPGDPLLAGRVANLLSAAGIPNGVETSRGWDHGIFVPLKVMFPNADIPVVQLSMQRGLNPAAHLAIGRALKPLREEGVLILGSGQSYHNMRGFFGRAEDPAADVFDACPFVGWMGGGVSADPDARQAALRAQRG